MSLYHQLRSADAEIYKQFKPDFFDLIVVDECHRSSAKDDSNWHEILEYFSSATQIGMTATPKETNDVSNIKREDNYILVPYYTAGGDGLLKCVRARSVIVNNICYKNVLVGFSDSPRLIDGAQVILHKDIVKG